MNDFVPILKAIADETRFLILNLLLTNDFCVGALSSRLDISKAAVSQHLQVLRRAGLVRGEKRGYWTHYTVQRSLLYEVADALMEAAKRTMCVEAVCTRAFFQNIVIKERRGINMCKDCCEHPQKLKEKSEECSEEQIKECHGDNKVHPCKGEDK